MKSKLVLLYLSKNRYNGLYLVVCLVCSNKKKIVTVVKNLLVVKTGSKIGL